MHIGVVAGEASGDLLGAGLIEAISRLEPAATFSGVAGPRMQAAGCEAWEDSEALAVMGLVEPLKELPRLLRLRRMLVDRWSAAPPDVFVGIDSPEFNLGVAARLKANGIRTLQYVSPQVWAWRQRRVQKIGRAVDCVLCLLPFEKTFYDQHNVNAVVVGHPLADSQPEFASRRDARQALGLPAEAQDRQVVTVMPGSRRGEVTRLGPVFAQTVAALDSRHRLAFVAPMANSVASRTFSSALSEHAPGVDIMLTDGDAPRRDCGRRRRPLGLRNGVAADGVAAASYGVGLPCGSRHLLPGTGAAAVKSAALHDAQSPYKRAVGARVFAARRDTGGTGVSRR